MEESMDKFLEYIALVEESSEQFSSEQFQKLELIRSKVSDLLKRAQPPSKDIQTTQISQMQQVQQPVQQIQTNETIINSFSEFTALHNKISNKK